MKVQCLCEHSFEVTPLKEIDLDKNYDMIEKIKKGSFNSFQCPKCGSDLRTDVQCNIIWNAKKANLVFIPEKNRIECLNFCSGSKSDETKKMFNNKSTPVIGYIEFVDRIKVLESNLDPVAIEALKFITLDHSNNPNKESLDIFFNKLADDKIEFLISGIKKNELAVLNISKSIYDSLLDDYKKKNNKRLFNALYLGNYLSYKNIMIEGDESV